MTKVVTKVETVAVVNKGYRVKLYHLNLDVYKVSDLSKQPNQLKIILDEMSKRFNKTETAARGQQIVESAIANNSLKTVISPDVLFAYYVRKMEQFGVTLN
jgi:hypothetical protein